MVWLDLREPASAATHALGCLAAIPATWWLWRRAASNGGSVQVAVLVYGLSLTACLGSSAAYHAAPLSHEVVAALRRIDHIGIHLLIAGTYTPIAQALLRGRMRTLTLGLAWAIAVAGSTALMIWGVLPPWVFTAVYLGAGWGGFFAYLEIARTHSHRVTRPLLLGGVSYSLGALLNVAGWPVLLPGVFEAHEVFHLFVLTGAALHFRFIADTLVLGAPGALPSGPRSRAHAPQLARPSGPLLAGRSRQASPDASSTRPGAAEGQISAPGAR